MKLELKNISKEYKGVTALNNINLEVETPAMIGFVGPNGAGKSTLMKLLVGQLIPSKGFITVDGLELSKNQNYMKEKLGYLPQDFGLYDELTVEQFLDYMACLKGVKSNKKEIIYDCIEKTNLREKQKSKIKTLSGGQKQRVGIAQAMLNNPQIIIVDEPTVGLDPEERIKFRNLFSRGARDKIIILSTHIIEDVESICNHLIVLNEGEILFNGVPSELVKKALGHVGVIEVNGSGSEKILNCEGQDKFKIVSTMITPTGTSYRVVAEKLTSEAQEITPSLEDAYVYCMLEGGKTCEEQD